MGLFEEIITPRRLVVDPRDETAKVEDSFMKVAVGLGNPGKKYDGTRHNIGFACMDHFAKVQDMSQWVQNDKFFAKTTEAYAGGQKIIALKPQTYMNESGKSLQALKQFYKCLPTDFIVIHDELDLPLGTIRIRQGGSDAGHNGLKSINQLLGKDYWHIRVGIGRPPENIESADFVLAKFQASEKKLLPKIIEAVSQQCQLFISGKIENTTLTL